MEGMVALQQLWGFCPLCQSHAVPVQMQDPSQAYDCTFGKSCDVRALRISCGLLTLIVSPRELGAKNDQLNDY